jgi:mediator of RNA polymerase II transcription subunit 18, fungi type
VILETFSFTRENIELVFNRHYYLPDSSETAGPVARLPSWDELRLVDSARKWTLNVKLNVLEDNQPEKMKKANEELMSFKAELDSIFDFKVIDRRIFDTRIGVGGVPMPTK